MNKVVVIGYSGHAYVALDALLGAGRSILGYCDLKEKKLNPYNLTYLGSDENFLEKGLENIDFFVAIGDNAIRSRIIDTIKNSKRNITTAIHPTAYVATTAKVGQGCLVAANAVINPLAKVSDGCIINTSSVVEHECVIGRCSHIAPNASIAGNVRIGHQCFIGIGSNVLQNLTIGDFATIGGGSVVTKNVLSNQTVIGVPSRPIEKVKAI